MRFIQVLARSVLAVSLLAGSLVSQTTNGSIGGTVTDASGAPVQGVQVQVNDKDHGMQRTAMTGENGTYTIPQLPPGTYDLTVTKTGLATVNRTGVQLLVNQGATLDFQLSVASVSQTVEVTGVAPALNTTNA